MKNLTYFASLCALGAMLIVLAVAPLRFFMTGDPPDSVNSGTFTGVLSSAGMIAGYVAYLLVVFLLLGLAATNIPLFRRALRWCASQRRQARLQKSGKSSEVPSEVRRRGIPTRPGILTRRRIVMKIKIPPGW